MWIRGWIGKWFDIYGIQRVMYNGAEAMRIETVSRASRSILAASTWEIVTMSTTLMGLAMYTPKRTPTISSAFCYGRHTLHNGTHLPKLTRIIIINIDILHISLKSVVQCSAVYPSHTLVMQTTKRQPRCATVSRPLPYAYFVILCEWK